eukprot:4633377-Pyramimonas_sp.AAC.1
MERCRLRRRRLRGGLWRVLASAQRRAHLALRPRAGAGPLLPSWGRSGPRGGAAGRAASGGPAGGGAAGSGRGLGA